MAKELRIREEEPPSGGEEQDVAKRAVRRLVLVRRKDVLGTSGDSQISDQSPQRPSPFKRYILATQIGARVAEGIGIAEPAVPAGIDLSGGPGVEEVPRIDAINQAPGVESAARTVSL